MKATFHHRLYSVLLTGGLALAVPLAAQAGGPDHHSTDKTDPSDAQILGVADTANTGEIGQGNIALSKAQRDSVKQFAQLMVKDHTAAKDKGRAVAKELGLTPAPSGLSNGVQKDGNDATAQLGKATPENFDRTYMQLQVRLHEKVLKTLDELIPKADAQQVKALLTDMRGHVEHHLSAARTTLSSLEK
jgi:putative membrane protein